MRYALKDFLIYEIETNTCALILEKNVSPLRHAVEDFLRNLILGIKFKHTKVNTYPFTCSMYSKEFSFK